MALLLLLPVAAKLKHSRQVTVVTSKRCKGPAVRVWYQQIPETASAIGQTYPAVILLDRFYKNKIN